MKIVLRTPTFLHKGAVVFSDAELAAVIHALIEEHDRVLQAGGGQYSQMSIEELSSFIDQLQNYKEARGA